MSRPTDSEIVTRAVALLADGLLASQLAGRLMRQFGITRDRAARLAAEAMKAKGTER